MLFGGSGGTGPEPSTINIEFGGSGGTGPLPSAIRTGLLSGIDDSSGGSGGTGPQTSPINIEFCGSGGTRAPPAPRSRFGRGAVSFWPQSSWPVPFGGKGKNKVEKTQNKK